MKNCMCWCLSIIEKKNAIWTSCKVRIIFARSLPKLDFLDIFSWKFPVSIFLVILPSWAALIQADRRNNLVVYNIMWFVAISLAVPSKTEVYGRSIAGIAGSNPSEGGHVRLLCMLCVVWVAVSATCWSLV